ncbi:hypothetical protein Smic_66810 [Streptomyces microflavus]|uniref:Uncharacterized protein n=1 Tax=Streptomyces microflavus TaxID=1919 RepID=A0A7J0D2A5_STRMI|nr:hypothetical protein Smic_66810 [Streptomyces microflavus]
MVRRAACVRLRIPSPHRGRGTDPAGRGCGAGGGRAVRHRPGRLPDRIAAGAEAAGADVLADVLGPAPELARLLLDRYDEARVPVGASLSA